MVIGLNIGCVVLSSWILLALLRATLRLSILTQIFMNCIYIIGLSASALDSKSRYCVESFRTHTVVEIISCFKQSD
jgi:hypothetical protein